MKGIWKNSEVKELFSVVEDYKDKNKSLREAFIAHAEKYGRKPNSVRNYYYHEVDNLKEDEKRLSKLGIDLARHNKTSIVYFSEEEELNLMQKIDQLVKRGVSVRKACLNLSGGDVGQMLRYQNKYRNFLAKQKINESNTKIKNEKVEITKESEVGNGNNIITFRKMQKTLTDSEVQSLFMGLVRLVKRNAIEESEEKYKRQITLANDNLRKAITELNNRERDFSRLKEDYLKIKLENSKLLDSMLKLRCEKANKLRIKLEDNKS